MSKRGPERAAPSLPTEVVMEILSWLPLEPLARAQLVSRELGELIQDHQFTEKHAKRTSCFDYFYNVVTTGSEDAEPGSSFCYLHGYDGLILLKNKNTHTRVLWNPASRRLLRLPQLAQKGSSRGFALSFVPSTKTYRLASFFKDKESGKHECQVLTPGPSMEWRRLEFPELMNGNAPAAETLVVPAGRDAHCVVLTRVGEETVQEIVSLDLETELLTLNRLPGGTFRDAGAARAIDCNGKLGFGVVVDKQELQVMVLQDFKKGRWSTTKIPLPFMKDEKYKGRNVLPLFIKEGEVLFWLEDEKVFAYTVETGEINDVIECKRFSYSNNLHIHKPSLVGFEGMIEDDELESLHRVQVP